MTSQLIASAVAMLIIGGLLYAFLREGTKIKRDPGNKPPSDQRRAAEFHVKFAWQVPHPR